jgi:hypothetical protein
MGAPIPQAQQEQANRLNPSKGKKEAMWKTYSVF